MKQKVCVSGLGHVGLPTSIVLKNAGYSVHGVDTDESTRIKIALRKVPFLDSELETLLKNNPFEVSAVPVPADIHIIAVPTPLGKNNQADLAYVENAIDALIPVLREQDLIIIESTCPIGTTRRLAQRFPSNSFAYCPERLLPGNLYHELLHNDRIVGGLDAAATQRAAAFYRSFIKGQVVTTDAQTAEAAKLAENAYRDVNIAFANELSMIMNHTGLDVREVIQLANRHPRVNILDPGPGVGGHCIPIDPWFLVEAAPFYAQLISQARAVNTKKCDWVIEKIRDAIKKYNIKSVACLGLTYKANASDLRESPALCIVKTLEKEINVIPIDPFVPDSCPIDEGLEQGEMVVALVAHSIFHSIPKQLLSGKPLLDFAGVFQ